MSSIANMRFEHGESAVEIEEFDQKENGGQGVTYTIYYYPDRLTRDYDLDKCESFDMLSKAIEKTMLLLDWKND